MPPCRVQIHLSRHDRLWRNCDPRCHCIMSALQQTASGGSETIIPKMNARSEPIHGKFMLPENFDLIYATADTGKDQIFNKALATSDKLSKAMRLSIQSENNAKHFLDRDDEEVTNRYSCSAHPKRAAVHNSAGDDSSCTNVSSACR